MSDMKVVFRVITHHNLFKVVTSNAKQIHSKYSLLNVQCAT